MQPGKWRDAVTAAQLTPCARRFADKVLAPLRTRSGRFLAVGIDTLCARYAESRGRPSITRRRVLQLLAELVEAGVLERAQRPAPGRPARYRALAAELLRTLVIRPRGRAPRRLYARFVSEMTDTETLIP